MSWVPESRSYYEKFFPAELVAEMASRALGALALSQREFAFQHWRVAESLPHGQQRTFMARHKSFKEASALRKYMTQSGPAPPRRLELGGAFSLPADRHDSDKFVPLGRELVFDIDLTDYDSVRFCCSEKRVCNRCWILVVCAAEQLDNRLREEFGLRHLLWVFSGRRGLHCWVLDEEAFYFTDTVRRQVTKRICEEPERLRRSQAPSARLLAMLPLLRDRFDQHAQAQGFARDVQRFGETFRDFCLTPALLDAWRALPDSRRTAAGLEAIVAMLVRRDEKYARRPALALEMILHCVYARIDDKVSLRRDHLLKAPFSVHPGTGRICVPLTLDQVRQLDVERELLDTGNVDAARIEAYADTFVSAFPWRQAAPPASVDDE